jgi:hypothetical protein
MLVRVVTVRIGLLATMWLSQLGCGPAVGDDDDGGSADETGDELGERPSDPGAMYSACAEVSMCAPLEFCVFPDREGGFCSAACAGGNDASACAPAPGDGAEPSCLDIGIPDGRLVCALDCSDAACPAEMHCEGIETPTGARRVCF